LSKEVKYLLLFLQTVNKFKQPFLNKTRLFTTKSQRRNGQKSTKTEQKQSFLHQLKKNFFN